MFSFRIISIIIVFSVVGCTANNHSKSQYKNYPQVDFCDLPKYEGKEIVLHSIYAGTMEYWQLGSLNGCNKDLHVDLDLNELYKMPKKFQKVFNNKYRAKYLIVEALGKYETGRNGGYGHLGSNNARFLVKEIISVK